MTHTVLDKEVTFFWGFLKLGLFCIFLLEACRSTVRQTTLTAGVGAKQPQAVPEAKKYGVLAKIGFVFRKIGFVLGSFFRCPKVSIFS